MNHIPSKAWRLTILKIILLSLLTTAVVLQLCIIFRSSKAIPEPGYRAQLSRLVWKLHDKGMEFRGLQPAP